MGIQPTSAYTALSFMTNPPQQRQTSASTTVISAVSAKNVAEKITISQAARDLAVEENKNGGTYNFTDICPNDMLSTINNLIKSGQMSLDESSSLLAVMPISVFADANGSSEMPAAANQKMNFFSALENLMAFNKSIHNDAAAIYDQKALSALERFQGAH